MSGVATGNGLNNAHVIRSTDSRTALWVGAIDDVWKLGQPRGVGGPWKRTAVKKGQPSDPYLMSGYHSTKLTVSHDAAEPVRFRIECDITGTGFWILFQELNVMHRETRQLEFPASFKPYWLRVTSTADCNATCQLAYGNPATE
jgi:hypothetical protein